MLLPGLVTAQSQFRLQCHLAFSQAGPTQTTASRPAMAERGSKTWLQAASSRSPVIVPSATDPGPRLESMTALTWCQRRSRTPSASHRAGGQPLHSLVTRRDEHRSLL
jgi:hypothetical protein